MIGKRSSEIEISTVFTSTLGRAYSYTNVDVEKIVHVPNGKPERKKTVFQTKITHDKNLRGPHIVYMYLHEYYSQIMEYLSLGGRGYVAIYNSM